MALSRGLAKAAVVFCSLLNDGDWMSQFDVVIVLCVRGDKKTGEKRMLLL